uniref:Secreted protein n=1 Tax=Rhizophora mucronata TaxID=61149 RepID=A0A2P2QNL8_RHIMU
MVWQWYLPLFLAYMYVLLTHTHKQPCVIVSITFRPTSLGNHGAPSLTMQTIKSFLCFKCSLWLINSFRNKNFEMYDTRKWVQPVRQSV